MKKLIKNKFDNWEISLLKFRDNNITKYKVTRRLPELSVAETKIFEDLEEAKNQFESWIN